MADKVFTESEVVNVSLSDPVGIVQLSEDQTEKVMKITLPAYFEWVWLLSYDGTVSASLSTTILQGETGAVVSGITKVPYRTATRITGNLSKAFYLRGSGRVQIIAQNYDSCPFNTGSCGF